MNTSKRWRPDDADTEVGVSRMDRRVQSNWFSRRRLAALGLVAVVAVVGILGYVRYGLTRTLSIAGERVVVSTVTNSTFRDYIPVNGNVQPRETVYLDAVDGGQVTEIFVEEGSLVNAGQPLVRLNNANLQLQVINSEAQVSEQLNLMAGTKLVFEQTRLAHRRELIEAEFQTEKAKLQLNRIEAIKDSGVVKMADIEDARLELTRLDKTKAALVHAVQVDTVLQREQVKQLDLAINGLNANLSLARQNMENLVIKAPIDGHLTSLDAHLGESKLPGQRLGQIDQVDSFKVVALVDEHYLARVTAGQNATTEIDGVEHRLRLDKAYPEVRDRQFKVDLTFTDATPASVRRGQTLQLRLEIGATSAGVTVANGAFYEDTAGQWAFVLDEGVARRQVVKFGRRNPEQVEILEGLNPGDRVITSSYETLKQYDRIELQGD